MNTKDVVAVFVGAVVVLTLTVVIGLTTHQSNIDKNQRNEKVKITCIQSGKFTSVDCNLIVNGSLS